MKNKILYWAPRVLGILSVLYISMFALDAFEEGMSFFQQLLGFMIHLAPSAALLAILAIAWHFERLGGVLFIIVALAPFPLLSNPFWVNVLLSAPFLFTGILFLVNSYASNEKRRESIETNVVS